MNSFALYRLPHSTVCTLVEQMGDESAALLSCTELSESRGFVMAPFQADGQQPIVLIRPDHVGMLQQGACHSSPLVLHLMQDGVAVQQDAQVDSCRQTNDFERYSLDFANFHAQLRQGTFRKIVLARRAVEQVKQKVSPFELFDRACLSYPRLFIALAYTPQSGLWLTATPEILLEGNGDKWRTIALAGTMQLQGDDLQGEGEGARWSAKNIQEQRFVATYITECLEQLATHISEEGPRTVRAANLVHLRSDFTFSMHPSHAGQLLQLLHPTPAVCGLPKREALDFIVRNESAPRRYYSGFMGPMGIGDAATHLYVSLRCMQLCGHEYHLYAGGGLLRDSQLEQEWQETEAKLQTMRQLISVI